MKKEINSFREYVAEHVPGCEDNAELPVEQLNDLRNAYIEQLLQEEMGDLTEVEKTVARTIGKRKFISYNLSPLKERPLTAGERLADSVASFGGSWKFIIIFFIFIGGWMVLNMLLLRQKAFDPYPFILLNLLLSCIAALQAPVIMMSQNRLEDKDRDRAEHDYQVNLKAEVEVRMLHEKIDHMLLHQNKRLLEIQKVQIELMENISKMIKK